MSGGGSVSCWIREVKVGSESAFGKLWVRFFPRLVEFARIRLNGTPRRAADEEDVASAAMQSFFRRTREGSYPRVRHRGELWRLLATIASHKAYNLIRAEKSQKRGGGRLITVPLPPDSPHSTIQEMLANLASPEPSPASRVMGDDSLRYLLSILRDDELRSIAQAKLEGRSNQHIADTIQRSVPTVERRWRLIRETWRREYCD
jgi:DNA-directed RNA polymerase specialized sigma24 family protein